MCVRGWVIEGFSYCELGQWVRFVCHMTFPVELMKCSLSCIGFHPTRSKTLGEKLLDSFSKSGKIQL